MILEAPGLDFWASKAGFQRFFRIFWEGAFQVSFQEKHPNIYKASDAEKAKKAKNANFLEDATQSAATKA